jgi:hypothetical protein
MSTDKTKTKAKRGRPYKNPHLLGHGLTVISKDELKQLRDELANLRTQVEQTKADNEDSR